MEWLGLDLKSLYLGGLLVVIAVRFIDFHIFTSQKVALESQKSIVGIFYYDSEEIGDAWVFFLTVIYPIVIVFAAAIATCSATARWWRELPYKCEGC